MKHVKSELCQLSFVSCVGCCGNKFADKKSVAESIQKNTLEYHQHKDSGKNHKEFMLRSKELRESGICRNAIYDPKKDKVYCPLHPELNEGKDIRSEHNHCDTLHVCKTAFLFDLWDEERKKEFISFLKKKNKEGKLCWHSYSLGMADDSLLKEFEGLRWE